MLPRRRKSKSDKGGHPPRKSGPPNSLFGEILDWMLAPLLFLWPISIIVTHNVADSIANQPYDLALADGVREYQRRTGQPVLAVVAGSAVSPMGAKPSNNSIGKPNTIAQSCW